jgi:glycerol kinase
MQFQSDILNLPVIKPSITETTAYGVAGLAGIQSNLFDEPTFRQFFQTESEYKPTFKKEQIDTYITQWKNALQRSRHWS